MREAAVRADEHDDADVPDRPDQDRDPDLRAAHQILSTARSTAPIPTTARCASSLEYVVRATNSRFNLVFPFYWQRRQRSVGAGRAAGRGGRPISSRTDRAAGPEPGRAAAARARRPLRRRGRADAGGAAVPTRARSRTIVPFVKPAGTRARAATGHERRWLSPFFEAPAPAGAAGPGAGAVRHVPPPVRPGPAHGDQPADRRTPRLPLPDTSSASGRDPAVPDRAHAILTLKKESLPRAGAARRTGSRRAKTPRASNSSTRRPPT